jgi:hypothetical protein
MNKMKNIFSPYFFWNGCGIMTKKPRGIGMNQTTKLKTTLAYVTALFAACGFLLRSYQLKWELNYDGSLTEGAFVHRVLPLICVCFLAGTGFLLYRSFSKLSKHEECFSPSLPVTVLQMAAGGLLFCGNLHLQTVGHPPFPDYVVVSELMLKIEPYAGMLAGILLALYGFASLRKTPPTPLFYMFISLYLALRLLICFQQWNTDPSIHHYGYQLLAVICSMLGSFRLAGFGFDKGHRRMSLFFAISAVLFCSITVADTLDNLNECLVNGAFLLSMGTSAACLLFAKD